MRCPIEFKVSFARSSPYVCYIDLRDDLSVKPNIIFVLSLIPHLITLSFVSPGNSQTLRQIGLTRQSARTPEITITSSSVSLNSAGALVQATAGLEKQKIEINTPGRPNTVIDIYAETSVNEITLYDPSTYTEASANTNVIDQDINESPSICGAAGGGNPPNTAGTITDTSYWPRRTPNNFHRCNN